MLSLELNILCHFIVFRVNFICESVSFIFLNIFRCVPHLACIICVIYFIIRLCGISFPSTYEKFRIDWSCFVVVIFFT